jgi:hypothetical protein
VLKEALLRLAFRCTHKECYRYYLGELREEEE